MKAVHRIMVQNGGKDSMNLKKNDFLDIGIMLYLVECSFRLFFRYMKIALTSEIPMIAISLKKSWIEPYATTK